MLITYQQKYVDATVLLKIECDKNIMQLDTCNDRLLNGVRVPEKAPKNRRLRTWKGKQC